MVQFDPNREFKTNTPNEHILNAIRNHASNDYQRRIPEATKANLTDTLNRLVENRPMWNEFTDALINRIGLEIFRTLSWNNPLAAFKIGQLEFGDTIEEIMVGLLEAKVYDPDREYLEKDLFGTERPEVQTSFHKVNRRNFYKISVNEPLLQQAFINPNGLANFVSQLMASPLTSANYDEYLMTTQLFAEYQQAGGFFNIQVADLADVASDGDDARYALRRMREMGGTLPFLSRHYNAAGMPAFANQEDLLLIISARANAAVDVEALAGAFNIDKADMPGRTVVIPEEHFGIAGAQAIMTTKDFFVIADQKFETTSQWNPVGLHNNYFLHHWQVISASRFVPAVLFSTNASTEITTDVVTITSVETPETVDHDFDVVTEVERGMTYGANSWAITDPTGAFEDQVIWSVEGAESSRTYITQTGTLHVAPDEPATGLTVTATSGFDQSKAASVTVDVTGDVLTLWPNPNVAPAPEPDPTP